MGFYIDGSGQRANRYESEDLDREDVEPLRPAPGKSSRTHGGSDVRGIPGKISLTARLAQRIDRYARAGHVATPDEHARELVARAMSATGQPLPASARDALEQFAGTDLSDIRVQTGPDSARAAEALDAEAFTVGRDIHFASGAYNPDSADGRRLIAHEVAHTVQQRGLPAVDVASAPISEPEETHERHADEFAGLFERASATTETAPARTTAAQADSKITSPGVTLGTGQTARATQAMIARKPADTATPAGEQGDLAKEVLSELMNQLASLLGGERDSKEKPSVEKRRAMVDALPAKAIDAVREFVTARSDRKQRTPTARTAGTTGQGEAGTRRGRRWRGLPLAEIAGKVADIIGRDGQVLHKILAARSGSTDALRPDVRGQMEHSFGEDFSGVEVSQGLGSTAGQGEVKAVSEPERIRFAAGKLDQDSEQGRALIGEEFAHVVQKRRGSVTPDEVDAAVEGHDSAAQTPAQEHDNDAPDASANASGGNPPETQADAPTQAAGASATAPAPAGARAEGAAVASADSGVADTGSLGSLVESFIARAPAAAERAQAEVDTQTANEPPATDKGAEPLTADVGSDMARRDVLQPGESPSDNAPGLAQTANQTEPREQLEDEAKRAGEQAAHGQPASIASGARAPEKQYGIGDWLADRANQVGRGLRSAGSGIANFGKAAWGKVDGVRRGIGRFRTTVRNGIASGWNGLTSGLGQGASWVEGKFDGGLHWLRRNGGSVGKAAAGYLDFTRDFDKGLLKGAWSAVTGLGTMAYHAGELINPVEWIFNPENNTGRLNTLYSIGSALTTKQGWAALWDGIKQPYVDAWNRGDYGEAIGMGAFEILSVVLGSKGLDKLGKVSKLSNAAKLGSAAGKLGTGSRIMGKLSAGLGRLTSGLQRGFGGLRGSLSRLPQKLLSTARSVFGGLGRKVKDAAGSLTRKAGSLFNRASQTVRTRVGNIVAKARSKLSGLLARNPVRSLIDGARRFVRSLPGVVRGLVSKLEGTLSRLAQGARAIAAGVQQKLGQVAVRGRAMLASLQQKTQKALSRARGWVEAKLAGVRQRLTRAQQSVSQAAQDAKTRVLGGFQRLTNGVRQRVAHVRQRMREGWNRWRNRHIKSSLADELGEEVADKLTRNIDSRTLAKLHEQIGTNGLGKLVRGLDDNILQSLCARLAPDEIAQLVAKGLDGHAIRELLAEFGDDLGKLAVSETGEQLQKRASKLARDRLQGEATELRKEYLKNKPVPKGGNAASAELTLDDGTRIHSKATSKKKPLDKPLPKSKGGHFEPSTDDGYLRNTDSEYKALSDLADQLKARNIKNPRGQAKLYTEREPCNSCANVIKQFEAKYGIKVEVYFDFSIK